MNRISIALGALAAFSLAFAGTARLLFPNYTTRLLKALFRIPGRGTDEKDDQSSLEQDLRDILDILPLSEMRSIVEHYARYDKQMSDTISFVNDQKRFIAQELSKIPHVNLFVYIVKELGLEMDHWNDEMKQFWKGLPFYVGKKDIEIGGLTGMISRILRLIPKDELHALLCQKVKESQSFCTFLLALRSQQFHNLCDTLQANVVLQRHFHWAKESGIEIIFALELFGDLYVYLTQEVY